MAISPAHLKEIVVYTGMTFAGLSVDMGLSILLVYGAGLPLLVSGICGLLAGAVTNYFIHLKVTFKHRALPASWSGLFKYLQTCAVGAIIRVVILAILGWFSNIPSLVSLGIATAFSFAANYILSRFYVFRQKSD